jgi:glycosyltransferase involved in cell wall biosynthesis
MGNPVADLLTLFQLIKIFRALRPGLVHNVSVKLILLGSLAAWIAAVPRVLNAYTGLGTLFHSPSRPVAWLRGVLVPALAFLVRRTGAWALFQNPEDRDAMQRLGLAAPERSALVCGAGVDTDLFHPTPEPGGDPVVLFVGRLLKDKGIGEFVGAATALRGKGVAAQFRAAGEPDPENPQSIPQAVLDGWRAAGPVQWLGQMTDMPALLSRSHIVCLPSYHEGVPKALLEAAASGRPVVATDIAGCRMVVEHKVTGLLVPLRDAAALGTALESLIMDSGLRRTMGASARERAQQRFAAHIINKQVIDLYQRMNQA